MKSKNKKPLQSPTGDLHALVTHLFQSFKLWKRFYDPMKKNVITAIIITVFLFPPLLWRRAGGEVSAQNNNVGIGTINPDPSAVLDLTATDKGFLVPRLPDTASTDDVVITTTSCCDSFVDARDSKTYNAVLIGSQCWMAENLNIGTFVTGATEQTNNATIEKYCYADNAANCTTYGGLYQWVEMIQYTNGATNTASPSPALPANLQGICPAGWHLPTDAEWCTMENTVEAGTDAGYNTTSWRGTNTGAKLKTTTGWTTNNGTNTSGF